MCLCDTCKVELSIRESGEPACCAWFMDNVIIGGVPVNSCPEYRPSDSLQRVRSKMCPGLSGYILKWIGSNQFIAYVSSRYGRGEMIGHKDSWDFIDL